MSFSLFLGGTRGHSIIFFYQHHGYVVLYIPPLELFELIECWHFAVALCDANVVGEIAKGITLEVFTPASSVRGRRLAGGGGAPSVDPWLLERWHFIHLHLWIWVSAGSTQVTCFLCLHVLPDVRSDIQSGFFLALFRLCFIPSLCIFPTEDAISYQKCLPTFYHV